jgi:hypothetical protein
VVEELDDDRRLQEKRSADDGEQLATHPVEASFEHGAAIAARLLERVKVFAREGALVGLG